MKSFLGSQIRLCKLVSSQQLDRLREAEDNVLFEESSVQSLRTFETYVSQLLALALTLALKQSCEILQALEVRYGILRVGPPRDDLHLQ